MAFMHEEAIEFGVELLGPFLEFHSFQKTEQKESGGGSGGRSAWAKYENRSRVFEFHYRYGLGRVTYSVGSDAVRHSDLVWALNAKHLSKYPTYGKQADMQFRGLLHDLQKITTPFFNLSEDKARDLIISANSRPKGFGRLSEDDA